MFKIKGASREREPDTYVPYVGHATPNVLLLDDGSLLGMVRLGGIAWETTDPAEINARHAQRNILLRNVASERLVLATHVVRTMADGSEYPVTSCRSDFARELDAAYRSRLMNNRLYRNELFLSVLLRPAQQAGKRISGMLNRRRRGDTLRAAPGNDLDRLETVPGDDPSRPARL